MLSAVLIGLTDLQGGLTPGIYYEIGTIIIHKRYGYRGVIVAIDGCCTASDTWYESNKTQPSKEQPWYHILVDQSGGLSTYVAQSNLEEDLSGVEVDHPRLSCYFTSFSNGRYKLKNGTSYGGCTV